MKLIARRLLTVCGSLLLAATMASPANAALMLGFSGLGGAEYDTAGVYIFGNVDFEATDDDDGAGNDEVQFQIWDDGIIKFEMIAILPVGITGSVPFSTQWPGLIGTGAPGLGLVLNDIPNSFSDVVIDPFYLPHYSDPGECTEDCGEFPVPAPAPLALLGFGLAGLGLMRRRIAL